MYDRIPTYVYALDPISQAGIQAQLRGRPEVRVIDCDDVDRADVAVVVADEVDEAMSQAVCAIRRKGLPRVVGVVSRLDDAGLLAAVEAGVCGLLRRGEATAELLAEMIARAARGDGTLPADLLGRLLGQVSALHREVLAPRGYTLRGLTEREVEVLRLLADGHDTAQIAGRLAYSERTVKNVIHDVTTRFNLRNRSHAVAYALRCGLI